MSNEADSASTDRDPEGRLRVLIAGGGVAALEGLLALRALAGELVAPMLIAPDPRFRFRPLSVTEPFEEAGERQLDLAEVALGHDATFLRDALASVDPDRRRITTEAGRELEYGALLVAIGTRRVDAVPGALTFRDSEDHGAFRGVLDEVEAGSVRKVAFVVPNGATWPLGVYELALLTAARVREQGLDAELTIVTPEVRPLAVFGRRASAAVGKLLDRAGVAVRLRTTAARFEAERLEFAEGTPLECDRVVALPTPEVPEIPGLPRDHDGFIPVNGYGEVLWLDRIYAAGDATWFPIKQGGLATQQADSAAAAIAALAGAPIEPEPLRPVLRGALLTEWGPRYLRAEPGEEAGTAATSILWWPPAKVAGRYLAPFLARWAGYGTTEQRLSDLEPPPGDDAADVRGDRSDVVAVALSSADAKAREREFGAALRWLEVAEDLELYLPREYERKRVSWEELNRTQRSSA